MSFSAPSSTALVLSGGGVRGAYEAGVVAGIIDVLGLKPETRAPFQILAGTSVGAINATFLAAHSDRGDMAINGLIDVWQGLEIEQHFKVTPLSMLRHRPWGEHAQYYGRSLIDPRPLEDLVTNGIPWERLHANAAAGNFETLMLAALRISTGRTVIFLEQAPGKTYRSSPDPRRGLKRGPISAAHVLGSSAIPLIFPARRIGSGYYCDGGLRFNTPMAPTIRAGADRIVVISVKHQAKPTEDFIDPATGLTITQPMARPSFGSLGSLGSLGADEHAGAPSPSGHHNATQPLNDVSSPHSPAAIRNEEDYPNWTFLAGKVLDALLLDQVPYDLQVLERFNRLIEVLESNVPAQAMAKVEHVLMETRGNPYRRIRTLVFRPSIDIGRIAGEHVRTNINLWNVGPLGKWLLGRAGKKDENESDWASYLLFDGTFTKKLVDLGRNDAIERADDIVAFFR